jgi:hypothetical protein
MKTEPKRPIRADGELKGLFERNPTIRMLYDRLQEIPNLKVVPDGTGRCVFKVYREGHMGQYEGFLWVNLTLHKSYVQWRGQGERQEQCRELWGTVVKDRSNPDGSELKQDVEIDTIYRITGDYAKLES